MDNRRTDDERINQMQEDIEEIKEAQKVTNECIQNISSSVCRLERAVIGESEIGHSGLVKQTQSNSDEIMELKTFKKLICIIATIFGAAAGVITNIITSFIKWGFMKELTGTMNGKTIKMDEWVYNMMLELNARLS